jgi:hypothetical protein
MKAHTNIHAKWDPNPLLFLICEEWGVESKLGPLGTAAIYCPIVPAPGDCEDENYSVEWRLTGETEVLGENLP